MTKDNDSPSPDIQRLAREYVDLWEAQVKTLAGDEGFATAMAKTFELMNASAAGIAATAAQDWQPKQGNQDEPGDDPEFDAGAQSATGPGAEASGFASGDTEHDVNKLLERIDQLERRIAKLEKER